MISVLMVDDYPSIIAGTKLLLEQEGDIEVCGAYPPREAIECLKQRRFDVLLIDWQMPDCDSIELAKQLLSLDPAARILIFTGSDILPHFNLMVETGIAGFVPKSAGSDQLANAVRCAMRGEAVLPVRLMQQLRTPAPLVPDKCGQKLHLTDRELQILRQIARGKSNKEIANALHTSQRSLEYLLTDLFHKLHVKSRVEAAMEAKELGLLDDSGLLRAVD